jgi:hypothetical protein
MLSHEPACNLLWGPFAREFGGYGAAKICTARQLAGFGTLRAVPSRLIRRGCTILRCTSVSSDLATDGRHGALQGTRDGAQGLPGAQASGDLLAFAERQGQAGPRSIRRANAARARQKRIDRRRVALKSPANRTHRLATLPAIPNLRPLLLREKYAATVLHGSHSFYTLRMKCCGDPLNPPWWTLWCGLRRVGRREAVDLLPDDGDRRISRTGSAALRDKRRSSPIECQQSEQTRCSRTDSLCPASEETECLSHDLRLRTSAGLDQGPPQSDPLPRAGSPRGRSFSASRLHPCDLPA